MYGVQNPLSTRVMANNPDCVLLQHAISLAEVTNSVSYSEILSPLNR
jgi:hypothetical protein